MLVFSLKRTCDNCNKCFLLRITIERNTEMTSRFFFFDVGLEMDALSIYIYWSVNAIVVNELRCTSKTISVSTAIDKFYTTQQIHILL